MEDEEERVGDVTGPCQTLYPSSSPADACVHDTSGRWTHVAAAGLPEGTDRQHLAERTVMNTSGCNYQDVLSAEPLHTLACVSADVVVHAACWI